jgi:hypothetical protein
MIKVFFPTRRGALAVIAVLAAGCGQSGPSPGSIQVKWQLGFDVPCTHAEAGIDTVRVRVLEPGGREVFAPTFPCAARAGVVQEIPIGTYNLELEGGVGANFTIAVFAGSLGGVIVESGQTVKVEAALEKVPPSQNPGGLQVAWTFEAGLCGANNVANVRLLIWREMVYREHDQVYPCDTPAPGYVELAVAPGEYGVVAEGLDVDGHVVRRATRGDVTVEQGLTTSLVGSEALLLEPVAAPPAGS